MQWLEVLVHIQECLEPNGIPSLLVMQRQSTTFPAQLNTFKTSSSMNVLLLPFNMGSRGLNIVEATHVLLVEPQLNISAELQAIGRIHRIGQTRWVWSLVEA